MGPLLVLMQPYNIKKKKKPPSMHNQNPNIKNYTYI